MRKIDWLHHASSRQLLSFIHEIDGVSQPLTEQAILEIQEKFLSNGFQYIKAQSIKEGRSIISTFINTLNIYSDIACLSTSKEPLPHGADIYGILEGGGYLSSFEQYFLEEFFIEYFYYDFMWIEATLDMLTSAWFEDVKKTLINTAIDQHIPILVCVYDK
jgi:hypothetical protein